MTRRTQPTGRYTVGDKLCPSLGCAIAYCMDLAGRTRHDQYVREIGKPGALHRAEYRDDGTVQGVRV